MHLAGARLSTHAAFGPPFSWTTPTGATRHTDYNFQAVPCAPLVHTLHGDAISLTRAYGHLPIAATVTITLDATQGGTADRPTRPRLGPAALKDPSSATPQRPWGSPNGHLHHIVESIHQALQNAGSNAEGSLYDPSLETRVVQQVLRRMGPGVLLLRHRHCVHPTPTET